MTVFAQYFGRWSQCNKTRQSDEFLYLNKDAKGKLKRSNQNIYEQIQNTHFHMHTHTPQWLFTKKKKKNQQIYNI